ncbi:MAG: hypothetical protein HY364_02690 [Candidatus Aenigmarchaeota archaeon]|nr:hypothetical protein [Candidatus Aenigmarchaeota archaeon]
MITDTQVMKISFICAILGIIGLIVVVYTYQAPHLASFSDAKPGEIVSIGGVAEDVKRIGETTIITVNGTKIVIFSVDNNIKKDDRIQATGRIEIYEGKTEMIANSIRKV